MRRVQGHTERPVRRHDTAAEQGTRVVAHLNGRAGFTGAGQQSAVCTDEQVARRQGRGGVSGSTTAAPPTAAANASGGRTAGAQQAEPGNRKRRGRTAYYAGVGDELVEGIDFVECETVEGLGVVLRLPKRAVFALEHHVAVGTVGRGIEKVGDFDVFAIFQVHHKVLPIAGDRSNLAGRDGHLNNGR